MKQKLLLILFFGLLFVIAPKTVFAATYYVTETTQGTGDGSSYANAMSVEAHNSGAFNPDDTIYLCDTITSTVVPPSSGTDGHLISYKGDYAGHAGIISLGVGDSYAINLSTDYCMVENITLNGNKASRDTGTGILLAGSNNTVDNVSIANFFNWGILTAAYTTGHTITGCDISNIGGEGINKNTEGNAIRLNPGSRADITNCTLSNDSTGSHVIFLNDSHDNTISGNTISGGDTGIMLYGANNSIVINNTISDIGIASGSYGADFISASGTNCTISGNVGVQNVAPVVAAGGIELNGGANACNGTIVSHNRATGSYLSVGILGGGSTVIFDSNYFESREGNMFQNCDGSIFKNNYFKTTGFNYNSLTIESFSSGSRMVSFYNNTVVGNNGLHGIEFKETSGTWSAIELVNNIISGFVKGVVVYDKDNDGISIAHTNNDYFGNQKNLQTYYTIYTDIPLDNSEITDDPMLVNYVLGNGSPAIDAGITIADVPAI